VVQNEPIRHMKTFAVSILLGLALLTTLGGCGARDRGSATTDQGQSSPPETTAAAHDHEPATGEAPVEIAALSDQVIVYECTLCNRMFDIPGRCPFDQTELHATKVTYLCEFDGTMATRVGPCPKCGRPVSIEKAKMLPGGIRVERVSAR
jgi:hypothetical protein